MPFVTARSRSSLPPPPHTPLFVEHRKTRIPIPQECISIGPDLVLSHTRGGAGRGRGGGLVEPTVEVYGLIEDGMAVYGAGDTNGPPSCLPRGGVQTVYSHGCLYTRKSQKGIDNVSVLRLDSGETHELDPCRDPPCPLVSHSLWTFTLDNTLFYVPVPCLYQPPGAPPNLNQLGQPRGQREGEGEDTTRVRKIAYTATPTERVEQSHDTIGDWSYTKWVDACQDGAPDLYAHPRVIGGRAYAVDRLGHIVSYEPCSGWVQETHATLWQTPPSSHFPCLMPVGHLLLMCHKHRWRQCWSVYDTVSGDVVALSQELPGEPGVCGMFPESLAVLSGRVGRDHCELHYLNPLLVYPHPDVEWGMYPVGDVVPNLEGSTREGFASASPSYWNVCSVAEWKPRRLRKEKIPANSCLSLFSPPAVSVADRACTVATHTTTLVPPPVTVSEPHEAPCTDMVQKVYALGPNRLYVIHEIWGGCLCGATMTREAPTLPFEEDVDASGMGVLCPSVPFSAYGTQYTHSDAGIVALGSNRDGRHTSLWHMDKQTLEWSPIPLPAAERLADDTDPDATHNILPVDVHHIALVGHELVVTFVTEGTTNFQWWQPWVYTMAGAERGWRNLNRRQLYIKRISSDYRTTGVLDGTVHAFNAREHQCCTLNSGWGRLEDAPVNVTEYLVVPYSPFLVLVPRETGLVYAYDTRSKGERGGEGEWQQWGPFVKIPKRFHFHSYAWAIVMATAGWIYYMMLPKGLSVVSLNYAVGEEVSKKHPAIEVGSNIILNARYRGDSKDGHIRVFKFSIQHEDWAEPKMVSI
ncbi:hypothetical protein KIPB_002182 [Kipferlia bialata]|uniref:Uncharacterized protein n=1 Tax=Kipferlia bialata TaxID=797122 RepID=A0A9K3GFS6_9EUKA|nr:hypothetical protein KIPB_002182 [Kipferlia bialata]|eukprot:g2182.t1